MIFVTIGTQANSFLRFLKGVEDLIEECNIKEEVVAQTGNTTFKTDKFKTIPFMSENEFKEYMKNATVVLTHAGSGSLFNAIKAGKKTIAVARLHKYNEMMNDHQLEIVKKLTEGGYILDGTDSLLEAWKKLDGFTPRGYDFESHVVEELDKYISYVFSK
jgi:UDP-N-acetylglucosamine transferase subunit ALG13